MLEDEGDELCAVQPRVIKTVAAMDSGAVVHTTPPETVPDGVELVPNTTGKHFSGAGGDVITKHGSAKMIMKTKEGKAGINWQVADVTRTLQSVSQTTGPQDGEGKYDVIFNNKIGAVVRAGIVEEVLRKEKPLATYHRQGGLYLAEIELQGFPRPGNP